MNAALPLHQVKNWGRAVLDFVYPPVCPLCHNRLDPLDKTICLNCELLLTGKPDWECPRCGGAGSGTAPKPYQACRLCPPDGSAWQGALSVTGYSGEAAACIHLFKYLRREEVGKVMARLM